MLVTRYLFKNLFTATVFVAVVLTLVIWLTQSLKLLELVASSDAPAGMFIRLVALTLPKFLEIILPLSLVIAVIFTYNRLIMDNEIVVLRSCGVDQYGLARPAILLAVGASLFLTLITTWISPRSFAMVDNLRQTIQTQYSAFLLREGVFNTFGSDLTIYLRARQDNGDMTGLMIYDARNKDKPPAVITAKKGRITMDGNIPDIIVFDGMRQQLDPASGALSKLYFSQYAIQIKGLGGAAQEHWKDAEERTLPELLNPDLSNARDREHAPAFRAEAFARLVTPWNALGFTMTALATLLLGPFNRRGQHARIAAAAGLIVLLQALSLTLVDVSQRHPGAVPVLYLATLLPVAAGFYLLHFRGERALMAALHGWRIRRNKRHDGTGAEGAGA
ncbi:MAG: LptF/LptG family permease [Alphaproteobacteria bacterium]|nr:LptF/LptG family permease [Alphaproteobacteria bacterium]